VQRAQRPARLLPCDVCKKKETYHECVNGIDDDGDGKADCQDADCQVDQTHTGLISRSPPYSRLSCSQLKTHCYDRRYGLTIRNACPVTCGICAKTNGKLALSTMTKAVAVLELRFNRFIVKATARSLSRAATLAKLLKDTSPQRLQLDRDVEFALSIVADVKGSQISVLGVTSTPSDPR